MRKRSLLCALLILVGLSLAARADDRPNVLFLFADDQRPDTIGAWGNPHIATPHLDRLVARGFSFRRNYCMGSIHGAVCQPSRAMVMTGRTLYRVPMDLKGVQTLPEVLRDAGYATFATGKWHNGADSCLRMFERGRSILLGGMSNHVAVPVRDKTDGGTFGPKRISKTFSSELFADEAIEFLKSHDGEKPFFAYVSFTAPHDPRQPPERFRQRYYDARPPLPPNFKPQHPFDNGWLTGRDEKLAAWPRTKDVIADQLAEYYGMITHLDAQVGRVLEALEKAGHAKNTVVVYAADHGLAVGSHGLLGKQNLYEHSMGCPLVVAGPGVPEGRSSTALTYLLDIFPTLCAMTGCEVPAAVEGKSLRGLWDGGDDRVRSTLFTTYEDLMRSVRDSRWKLIRYPPINHTQLFDLDEDPHELHNLADEPEHAARVQQMMTLLRQWQRRTDDTQPLTSASPRPMAIDLSGRPRKPDRHQPDWIRRKYFPDHRDR